MYHHLHNYTWSEKYLFYTVYSRSANPIQRGFKTFDGTFCSKLTSILESIIIDQGNIQVQAT